MSRLSGSEVANLMEAYNAVYTPNLQEEVLFEEFLTEEFILEAYQYVADFLVSEGHVPGYETAELFMSEMDEHWIDEILCDHGLTLTEGPFSNFANTVIGGAKRAASAVSGGVRGVAGAADRGVAAGVRAAQAVKGTAQRAAGAVARGVTTAGQTVAGAAQRAGSAAVRAATPVAQAVKGTAQRAVAAGQSALGGAARAVQGAGQAVAGAAQRAGQTAVGAAQRAGSAVVGGAQRAGQAVTGAAQRAGSAVAGAAGAAANKIGQEIEISRRVGAGQPLPASSSVAKTAPQSAQSTGMYGKYAPPSAQVKTPTPAAPAARPASTGTTAATPKVATPTQAIKAAPSTSAAASGSVVPATNAAAAAPKPITPSPSGTAPAPARQSLRQQTADLEQMRKASQQRIMAQGGTPATPLVQSFDLFDIVKGHLLDEGYADTEEAAIKIMANMGEEWKQEILDEAKYGTKAGRKRLAARIRKGENIGKKGPGTGFKAVEKAAEEGGATDPTAVAAAAMWKKHGGKK